MKIGTISLNINAPDFNYGAMLHSWAFQQFLKRLDIVEYTEIIDYTMPRLEKQDLEHPIITAVKGLHVRSMIHYIKNYEIYKKRFWKFQKFIENNLVKSEKKYIQSTLAKEKLDYDCVICESDVIWSPGFSGGHFDKSFFLALDSMKMMKKVAYAPSMANGDLNVEQEKELRELLEHLDYISCRESYEKAILERYTKKPITHVLDPVMLLNAEDYDAICEKRIIDMPYMVLYLPVDDNIEMRKCAERYAKNRGLQILEISTKLEDYSKGNTHCIGDAGIEQFLSAIRYADMVFTNSFHAVCFSIIFNVQFYGFSRAFMGKVRDVCEVFGLGDRFFEDDKFRESININYEEINRKWKELKEKSIKWLLNSINSGGGVERIVRILCLRVLYMIRILEIEQYTRVVCI